MLTLFAIAAFTLSPLQEVARERVDLIEVNHFYDEHARLVFDQVLFYDWSPDDARYMVRAWRLVKHRAQIPARDWTDGGYAAMWLDSYDRLIPDRDKPGTKKSIPVSVVRHVRSPHVRESWTQYDPELLEREYLPKERRRELRKLNPWQPTPKGQ